MGLTYVPDFSLFEHLRVYVRGYTQITRDFRSVEDQVPQADGAPRRLPAAGRRPEVQGRASKLGPFVRSDVVYLRMFKDVPHVDMEMHLPEQGTKVRMRWIDKAQIASPLVMGIPTLAMKLLACASAWSRRWRLGGLLIAPISAGVNSFFGFQRAKQKHLYAMIQQPLLPDPGQQRQRPDPPDRLGRGGGIQGGDARLLLPLAGARRRPSPGPSARLDAHIEAFLKPKSGRRDQLRGRRRPRQALPPRPRPPRRPRAGSTPSRSTRPSSPSTGTGTTRSATPDSTRIPETHP